MAAPDRRCSRQPRLMASMAVQTFFVSAVVLLAAADAARLPSFGFWDGTEVGVCTRPLSSPATAQVVMAAPRSCQDVPRAAVSQPSDELAQHSGAVFCTDAQPSADGLPASILFTSWPAKYCMTLTDYVPAPDSGRQQQQ